ncbi:MAG: ATP-binding cassette domain-containing protein [Treponema sp.]|nr:ATP-binding cassette domain-containing protein [Treponema sp.]
MKKNAESLIICENVSFGYNGYAVVNGISLVINSGDYMCVAGENGSGKTTFVKGVLGLIEPLGGGIQFSVDLKGKGAAYLAQQTALKKDFPASAQEIVLSGMAGGLRFRPFYSGKEKSAALENMKLLNIADLKDRCYRELSGGQQRRVLIARALCALRGMLVLDEPSAGLDPQAAAELYALLAKLNREMGITIIMVSHDIENALKYATRVLHIKNHHGILTDTAGYLQSARENETCFITSVCP